MKVSEVAIRNFRRLENVRFDLDDSETVLVGPNNSGKTSATVAFRCFFERRAFSIHDFSVARIQEINRFGEATGGSSLPQIDLDLWFTVDPGSIAYARAFALLPRLSPDLSRLGIRLSFGVRDAEDLLADFDRLFPATGGLRAKSLSQFLDLDGNLKHYFQIRYYSLAEHEALPDPPEIGKEEGRKLLHSLLRVDFIDAQRMIDDADTSRSNKLSDAFAEFYKRNLDQAEIRAEANKVIDDNNRQLTEHYGKQFAPLISTIRGLGVPSINDREIHVISSLSPETALRGNTELLYIDKARGHELPELYNGLGFKNLIYMAVQARDYQSQWIRTTEDRALNQLLFVEEPEVHLHAQVQQAFIGNIRRVLTDYARSAEEPLLVPQILITTHSSHILDTVDFAKVRYFRRCPLHGESTTPSVLNASEVRSLKSFRPNGGDGSDSSQLRDLDFLKRYMRLTHCDLFFADAAILVEGAAERLLIPAMIEKAAPGLRSAYLSILEVGGTFAGRFEDLLTFLRIPYLIVTDLDAVKATGRHPACRADVPDAVTSNPTLKQLLAKSRIAELLKLGCGDKISAERDRCVAFPGIVLVSENGQELEMIPRTLEEAIVYQNFARLRAGGLPFDATVRTGLEDAYEDVYLSVKSDSFGKTDFALNLLAGTQDWVPPTYISEGLEWLDRRLSGAAASAATSGIGKAQ